MPPRATGAAVEGWTAEVAGGAGEETPSGPLAQGLLATGAGRPARGGARAFRLRVGRRGSRFKGSAGAEMAGITAQGVGSGIDIAGLVSRLVEAEAAPVTARLNRQEQETSAELSALGFLKSGLSSLQQSLKGLTGNSAFQAMSAVSSDESLLAASAGETAVPGRYQVEVLRLAQTHKLGSQTFDSTQAFGGSAGDELLIAAGEDSFSIDLSTSKTLAQIRDAINGAEGNAGIRASLLQVAEGQEVLMITAAGSGQAQAVTLTATLAGTPALSFETVNQNAAGEPLAELSDLDAAVRIDGFAVTRPDNRLSDVIEGLTIYLKRAEPGTSLTLEVSADRNAASSAVAAFVQQYNSLVDALTQVSGYKGPGVEQAPLFGDAATRGLGSRLRAELSRAQVAPEGGVSTLSEIGLRTDLNGKLTLDTSALATALADDPEGVGRLLGAEGGLAGRLEDLLSPYTGADGILSARTNGLEGRLERIDDSRESLERRLTVLETRYRQQFTAMDALVGQLMTTSDFLSQQLGALAELNNNRS
jgi:flagellar hook-associated protein 2